MQTANTRRKDLIVESQKTILLRDILNRNANGKTIWQPRIECWYSDRQYRGEELPSMLELFNDLNISNRLYQFNECIELCYTDPAIRSEERKINEMTTEYTIETPVGTANAIYRGNSSNFGWMPLKWWIETEEELAVHMYIEEHTNYKFNRDKYDELLAVWGHLGLPCVFVPRVNIQHMFINASGVENTIYLLNDCQDSLEAYFDVLNRSHLRFVEMLNDAPFEWVNYGDNIHSKVLSPKLFEKYVLPAYQQRNEVLRKADKFIHAHFDGDVKELLPYFKECGLDGIEAITPLPQGDVTLKEARDAMGDIFLIDGIAAILFDETYPIEMLKTQTEQCLDLFEGQLVLGISDEMSSTGILDRIKFVSEIVDNFNAKH